ncbi:Sorting nexin-33, partial [Ophiophagus hannah]
MFAGPEACKGSPPCPTPGLREHQQDKSCSSGEAVVQGTNRDWLGRDVAGMLYLTPWMGSPRDSNGKLGLTHQRWSAFTKNKDNHEYPKEGAFAKVKESQRMSDEGKMDQEEADGIRKRCRVVGFALQAEMNHFHERRILDFKKMMQSYIREQIVFYQRVSQKLEETLRRYDSL